MKETYFKSTGDTLQEPSPSMNPRTLPRDPIDDLSGSYHSCSRMVGVLRELWDKYGEGFAEWWKGMATGKQLETLMDSTYNTLPEDFSSKTDQGRKQARQQIQAGRISGCCIDMDVKYFSGTCDCQDSGQKHFFRQKLLHSLYSWTKNTTEMEQADLHFCKLMVDANIFPRIGDPNTFARLPEDENNPIEMLAIAANVPGRYRQQIEAFVASGLLLDVSTLTYAVTRKGRVLALLVKLFDVYQETVRRVPSGNPWERLNGCEHCRQGCESEKDARMCQTCEVTWWCCLGCKQASDHGKKCPNGKTMASAILFQF